MPVTYCDVFAFLWRSIQSSMGCFFDCFHLRHNHPPRRAPHLEEEGAQRTRLSSLFTAEEEREECVVKDRENLAVRRVGWSEIDGDLVEEAKFLKACGTIPATPAEIRKAVPHIVVKSSSGTAAEIQEADALPGNLETSDIHGACSVLESSPETPEEMKKPETLGENVKNTACVLESSPETPEEIKKQETLGENVKKSDLKGPYAVLKNSPNPTPRKITDDMQTPGTVFATNVKNLSMGNARIRSQYVYTVLNPIENLCQQQELNDGNSVLCGPLDHEGEYLSEPGNATPCSVVPSNGESVKKENIGDLSLSTWLKPPLPNDDGTRHKPRAASCRKPTFGRTPGDRPIIGLVATHWSEQEETSLVSPPKWWDGNGIPNSTTKYKEDQKVCWHATPFEERLEKALSEDSFAPQRKTVSGTPFTFEDADGNDDTATSQLQSMNCPNSVVSF